MRLVVVILLAVIVVAASSAPLLGLPDPLAQDIPNKFADPSAAHWLGTDEYGRDVLSRLLHGAQVELIVAIGATSLALVLGAMIGLLSGYFRGWIDLVGMRVVEIIVSFPPLIVALLFVTLYGPGQLTLIVSLGVLFAPSFARLVYAQTLSVREVEYVEAAKAFGAGNARTLFGVVLPNVATPIAVQFPITIAAAILTSSGLSYLGLGIVPPTPSWGGMVASGQRLMMNDFMLLLVPSIAVVFTVLAFGLLGDALRDWVDPRSMGKVRP
jgi:peptide/nickel transport system permease protein